MSEQIVETKPHNHLIWVDPDEFDALLKAFAELLKFYGAHDGVCAPEDIDNPDSFCVFHRENFNRRHSAATEALKAFMPDFDDCNSSESVLQ